jgi:hypothetical protein
LLGSHGFERIETGDLVNTYMRSKFEDTRRKALKFGAHGTTVKAFKPFAPGRVEPAHAAS